MQTTGRPRRFWSVGLVVSLAIVALVSPALIYLIFQQDFGDRSPPFDDLTMLSGRVEWVKWMERENSDGNVYDYDVYLKLRELSTEFHYNEPHEYEVYRALTEHTSVQLWVYVGEVWQVAVDGTVISSYQSRVAWGKSNAMVGKIFVSSFAAFILDLVPVLYLYQRVKKARGFKYRPQENEMEPTSTKKTVPKEQLPLDKSTKN